MRIWLSGPRILGGLVRPGISLSDREFAGMFASKPTNPLLAMSDAENALALADAYEKIGRLPEAKRAKARLAVEVGAAFREKALTHKRRSGRAAGVTFFTFEIIAAAMVAGVFGLTSPPSIGAMGAVALSLLFAARRMLN
jgi:hypothetical protein